MLKRWYRQFTGLAERYVSESADTKAFSLITVLFVGGGGVAVRGFGMALMLGAHLSLAWFSSASDLGHYFIVIGLTNILTYAGSLGFGPGAVRFVPGFVAEQRTDLQAGYVRTTLAAVSISTGFMATTAVVVAVFFPSFLNADIRLGLLLFAVLLPLTTLQAVSLDLLRAFGLPLEGQAVTSLLPPIILGGGAVLVAHVGTLNFLAIGVISCVSTAFTAFVQVRSLNRLVLRRLRGVTPLSDAISWLRVSLPIMASTLVFSSAVSIDWLVVASLVSVAQSAIYRIDQYLLSIQGVFFATFYGVVGTYVSGNFHRLGKADYEQFLRRLNLVQLIPTAIVCVILFVFAERILGLYGPGFVVGADALRIFALTSLFRTSFGPLEMLLNISSHEKTVMNVQILAVVLSAVLSVLLVRFYGMNGAAVANAVAWGSATVVLHVIIVRRLGMRISTYDSFRALLMGDNERPRDAVVPLSEKLVEAATWPALSAVGARYALDQMLFAVRFIATSKGLGALERTAIEIVPAAEVGRARGPRVVLPTGIATPLVPEIAGRAPFNDTFVTIFNPLARPGDDWLAVPERGLPVWWRHPSGTLTPAWNMLATVYDVLTFREDAEIDMRDRHGRLPTGASPRFRAGVWDVPVVNEALALLIDAADAIDRQGIPTLRLDGLIEPPAIVLSHDCDQLRGNDLITQAIRAYRVLRPMLQGNPPKLQLVRSMIENQREPYKFYLDDLLQMLELEGRFGYRSVMYVLNGSSGRFGARSGSKVVAELIRRSPPGWEIGIHYNYDTFHSSDRFAAQKSEIEKLCGRPVVSGRAHYLRFDTRRTPEFVAQEGIQIDESLGWSSSNGYRAGIAGPFRPLDEKTGEPMNVIELPLVFMDANLGDGEDGFSSFESTYLHLERIGGVMSVLFHPGSYSNPEKPNLRGLYLKILEFLHERGARNLIPTDVIRIAEGTRPSVSAI